MFCGDLGLWFREIYIIVKAINSRTNYDWDTNSESIDIQQYYLAYSVLFLTDFTVKFEEINRSRNSCNLSSNST